MKPLSQRQKDILAGRTNLSPGTIDAYRIAWLAAGFEMPGQSPVEGEWKEGKWVFSTGAVAGVQLAAGYDGLSVRLNGTSVEYFEAK